MRIDRPPCRLAIKVTPNNITVREVEVADKGFLLVTMQPPAAFEDKFNAGYDAVHLPERLAVPGFETARRTFFNYPMTHGASMHSEFSRPSA
jgi:hypothetical protein